VRPSDVTIQVLVMASLLVALVVATGLRDENFFGSGSLRSISRDAAILSLLALGQAVVIIAGGIDLSVGSLVAFAPVLAMFLLRQASGLSLLAAVLIVLLAAVAIGLIHGLLICGLNLQPFLVTLCSLLILRGLSRVLTGDSTVTLDAGRFPLLAAAGSGTWLEIPIPVFIVAAALLPIAFFMHQTVPGRYVYAVGYNLEAARYSGVPVDSLRVGSYILSAVMTTVAAFLEAGSVGSVTPSTAGTAYEMHAITAAVLGGCALRGGQGSLLGVIVGATILRVLRSAVIFFNISTYWTLAVTGLVLLGAVVADALVKRRRRDG
jgi:ribose transport system permease protein